MRPFGLVFDSTVFTAGPSPVLNPIQWLLRAAASPRTNGQRRVASLSTDAPAVISWCVAVAAYRLHQDENYALTGGLRAPARPPLLLLTPVH